MNPLDVLDESWDPLRLVLAADTDLNELNNVVIPKTGCYPQKKDIFNVFRMPLHKVKVVILGQDPYPRPGDAVGLSFVNGNGKIPFSLRVMYKELESEGYSNPDINRWEEQGVFLMNTALTVAPGEAGSHVSYWRNFSQNTVKYLSTNNSCIWFLWGAHATSYAPLIANPLYVSGYSEETFPEIPVLGDKNYIFRAYHPASEAYGKKRFYGCDHFKRANFLLSELGYSEIKW